MLEKKPVIDHPLQNQHTALYCQTQIWTDKENTFVPMLLKASITYLHPSDNGQQSENWYMVKPMLSIE